MTPATIAKIGLACLAVAGIVKGVGVIAGIIENASRLKPDTGRSKR